ncbi:MAG: hypothetical protein JRE19_12600 [Deltaproteobacteria bacterium]|nr:hypothetical protein [Deltaproteobacteria bacterium]
MDRWRTRTAVALVVWAALFASPSTVDAGAWTQPKGGGYLKTWIRFQAAIGVLDGYHDDNGDFRYTGNYSETGIHFYCEYGVTDWLTVIGAWAPFQVYRLGQLGGTTARSRLSSKSMRARMKLANSLATCASVPGCSTSSHAYSSDGALHEVTSGRSSAGAFVPEAFRTPWSG